MTVYADVLFLVNFSLDYVSLYITGRLLSRPMRTWRLCAAAAVGACYAVAALFFDVPEILYLMLTLAVSAVMCVCAYRGSDVAGTVGASVLLFCVGCALGGAMTAIYSLGAGYSDALMGGGDGVGAGAGVMTGVALLATAAVAVGGRVARRRRGVSVVSVTVGTDGKTVTLDALSDSGNLLRDPASGRPALIISISAASKLLPPEAVGLARADDIASGIGDLPPELLRRVRLLPVSNVYGHGLLLGYRPDRVTVGGRDYDCILALSDKRGGFGGCEAVLPAELS